MLVRALTRSLSLRRSALPPLLTRWLSNNTHTPIPQQAGGACSTHISTGTSAIASTNTETGKSPLDKIPGTSARLHPGQETVVLLATCEKCGTRSCKKFSKVRRKKLMEELIYMCVVCDDFVPAESLQRGSGSRPLSWMRQLLGLHLLLLFYVIFL